MYALFERGKQIGSPFQTEKEVWEAALIDGLVIDVRMPDEEDRILPAGYCVMRVPGATKPRGDGRHTPYTCRR